MTYEELHAEMVAAMKERTRSAWALHAWCWVS